MQVSSKFSPMIESGVLEIVSPPEEFYPDFSNLSLNLGDNYDRVHWRSKQVLKLELRCQRERASHF